MTVFVHQETEPPHFTCLAMYHRWQFLYIKRLSHPIWSVW